MRCTKRAGGPPSGAIPDWSPQLALDLMDKHGIALAITSLAQPGVAFCRTARRQTSPAASTIMRRSLIAQHPRRFGCFGLLPMHDMDAAIGEARYCLETLRFEGISLFASYGEKFLGDSGSIR